MRCRNADTRIFFPETPEGDDDYSDEAVDEARVMCDTCPALQWCGRKFWNEPYGVFAGTTPRERGFRDGERFKKVRNPFK